MFLRFWLSTHAHKNSERSSVDKKKDKWRNGHDKKMKNN